LHGKYGEDGVAQSYFEYLQIPYTHSGVIWSPDEESASRELKIFIKNRIINYSEGRNFPNIIGTSKLSPFIKFGQIHVETIWNECLSVKSKTIGTSKFLAK